MNNDRHVNAIRYLHFLFKKLFHRNQHHQYTIFILTKTLRLFGFPTFRF